MSVLRNVFIGQSSHAVLPLVPVVYLLYSVGRYFGSATPIPGRTT